MSHINDIQQKILQLGGGDYQKLIDEYLYAKYRFPNIQPLGVQTGTNKPTKGIPDSYVHTDDDKYILICYGSVQEQPLLKIEKDILDCLDESKSFISEDRIKKIICGYTSTNVNIGQFEKLKNLLDSKGIKIELIGIGTLYTAAGKRGVHTRVVGLDRDTNKELLYKHIRASKESGTPFKELQQVLPSLSRGQIQVLLRELRKENRIHVIGTTSAARWFSDSIPTEND